MAPSGDHKCQPGNCPGATTALPGQPELILLTEGLYQHLWAQTSCAEVGKGPHLDGSGAGPAPLRRGRASPSGTSCLYNKLPMCEAARPRLAGAGHCPDLLRRESMKRGRIMTHPGRAQLPGNLSLHGASQRFRPENFTGSSTRQEGPAPARGDSGLGSACALPGRGHSCLGSRAPATAHAQ